MKMTCIAPPEPDEVTLLAYLDGAAEPAVVEHVKACPHCRARAARLYRMESNLLTAFYRRACPSPDELGEYHLGLLERKRASGITRHLAECPHCAREVAQLQSFLGELAPKPEVSWLEKALDQVRVTMAQLVSGGRELLSAPQLTPIPAWAGVRGGGAEPTIYQADDVQIIVGAQPSAGAAGRYDLLGLVTGIKPEDFTAHLWYGGQLIAAPTLDEGGNFTVHELASGSYELVLSGPGREIYIEELKV